MVSFINFTAQKRRVFIACKNCCTVFLHRDEEKFYMVQLLELGLVETVDEKKTSSESPGGKFSFPLDAVRLV